MDLFEAISARYSYRGHFRPEPVPREDLRRILAAGVAAPSGKNAQTTAFVGVDDPEVLAAIGRMNPAMAAMQDARAMVACVVDRRPEAIYHGHDFQIEDCAAAVENMLLAVTALGYASVWVDGWLRVGGRADELGAILGLPEDKIVRVLLPIGVPTEEGPRKPKRPFEERARFNRWGA